MIFKMKGTDLAIELKFMLNFQADVSSMKPWNMFISKGKKKGRHIFPAYSEEALMFQPSEPRLPTDNGRTRGTSQRV